MSNKTTTNYSPAVKQSLGNLSKMGLEMASVMNDMNLSLTDNIDYYSGQVMSQLGLPSAIKAHDKLVMDEVVLGAIETCEDNPLSIILSEPKINGLIKQCKCKMNDTGFIEVNMKPKSADFTFGEIEATYSGLYDSLTEEQRNSIGKRIITSQAIESMQRFKARLLGNAIVKTGAKAKYSTNQTYVNEFCVNKLVGEYEDFIKYEESIDKGKTPEKRVADPFSNKSLLNELNTMVHLFIGDDFKATSKHVNYLKMTCLNGTKQVGKAKPVPQAQFETNIRTVLYSILTGEDIQVLVKENKNK